MIKKIIEGIKRPEKILIYLNNKGIFRISDKAYLKLLYKYKTGKKLDLKNPKTFNEKLQWLKLYNRKPEYTMMVDKYEVKKYVAEKIGEEYIIPTLGVFDEFEEIDFEKLPNQFVIKTTHDSGGVVICKDKNIFDIESARVKINKSLKNNFYYNGREWPYKNVKPRIIIEQYVEDSLYHELRDYKLYCFNGKCQYIMLCFDRFINDVKFIYFDNKWNMKKEFSKDGIEYGDVIKVERPKQLDKMFEFASILSKNIPFVRVDFYEANGKLFFGELTFYPSAGFDNTRTLECQKYLDNALIIKNKIGGLKNENNKFCKK